MWSSICTLLAPCLMNACDAHRLTAVRARQHLVAAGNQHRPQVVRLWVPGRHGIGRNGLAGTGWQERAGRNGLAGTGWQARAGTGWVGNALASGIKDFGKLPGISKAASPFKPYVTIDELGNVAAFFLSDLASGMTGQIS